MVTLIMVFVPLYFYPIMDCQTARKTYKGGVFTAEEFAARTRSLFPGVVEYLEQHAQDFGQKKTNPFHAKVIELSGVSGHCYTVHMEDHDPLAEKVHEVLSDAPSLIFLRQHLSSIAGTPVNVGAICCSGCAFTGADFPEVDIIKLQNAAVQVEPDGTIVSL